MKLLENDEIKAVKSKKYNYFFNKKTGFFARWGETKEDDPIMAPAPEIADIEITTKCNGVNGKLCSFCYKSNTPNGKNMSFETFKKVFDNFPKSLTQIAFGADSQAKSNPDLWKMMDYCRKNGVIPNVTVAQLDEETADKLAKRVGAIAISRYEDKDVCYDTVKMMTDRGISQTNVHCLIAQEVFDNALETLQDRLIDPRLAQLNAIVFLSLKQKGRGKHFNPISQDQFKQIVDFSMENNIGIGFDSCSAYKYLLSVKEQDNFKQLEMYSEPCESSLFSIFCNVEAKFFPCSFSEGIEEWEEGLDLVNCDNFSKDIWHNPKTEKFRKLLLKTSKNNSLNCRECPLFTI